MFSTAEHAFHRIKLVEIEGGISVWPGTSEVSAAALHPENLDVLAGHRILLGHLEAGVSASKVGDSWVRAEELRDINEFGEAQAVGRRSP